MNDSNNKNAQSSGDALSWLIVFICLFAAPPLGVILLLVKLSKTGKGKAAGHTQQYYQNTQNAQYNNYKQAPQNNQATPSQARPGQPYNVPQTFKQNVAYQPKQQNQQYQTHPSYQNNVKRSDNKKAGKDIGKSTKKQSGKGLAALLMFLGILFMLTGTVFLSLGIGSFATVGMTSNTITMGIFSTLFYSSALFSFIERSFVQKRFRRFNKYSAVIGDHSAMALSEISKTVGESMKKTRKTLQSMIDCGCFGPFAYIDNDLDSLVLSHDAAEKMRADMTRSAAVADKVTVSSENQYVAVINELHMLCAKTSDPSICANIQRIEEVTVKIFKIVEDKPEKIPQIRRFMNYYLPTTLKLLHSYETLEKQGVKGENIMSAKQDIERVLDTLATGFEQQLDNLFKSDKIDISADINVLENLMEQDGLTNEGNILKTAGGT